MIEILYLKYVRKCVRGLNIKFISFIYRVDFFYSNVKFEMYKYCYLNVRIIYVKFLFFKVIFELELFLFLIFEVVVWMRVCIRVYFVIEYKIFLDVFLFCLR